MEECDDWVDDVSLRVEEIVALREVGDVPLVFLAHNLFQQADRTVQLADERVF